MYTVAHRSQKDRSMLYIFFLEYIYIRWDVYNKTRGMGKYTYTFDKTKQH